MAKTTLVGPDIGNGRAFLELLKSAGVKVRAAILGRQEDFGRWKLFIVTPLVEEIGGIKTYRRFIDILSEVSDPPIELDDVRLFAPSESFAKSLRREFRNVHDLPIAKTSIGARFIDDGFIFFSK